MPTRLSQKLNPTLYQRFLYVSLILTGVISVSFGLVVLLTIHSIESTLFAGILESQAKLAVKLDQQGILKQFQLPELYQLYKHQFLNSSKDQIPEIFQHVEEGFSEILSDTNAYHVYAISDGDVRYIMVYDQTSFEQQEMQIFVIIAFGILFSLLIGYFASKLLVKMTLKPLTSLAAHVQTISAEDYNADLEPYFTNDVVGSLANSFAHQFERIQNYWLQERLFTGDVSHELRTPLTVISGAAEVLEKRLTANKSQSSEVQAVARIRAAADEMGKMMNAFLLLSKKDPHHLTGLAGANGIAINSLVAEELVYIMPGLEKRKIAVEFVEHAILTVDCPQELISVVLRNIIQNAARHIEKGSIEVIVEKDSVAIHDTGPGIPEEIYTRVFHRMSRVESKHPMGHGMGLVIVKRICDYMNWDIDVETSSLGTTFRVKFCLE